jgi:hypothetical protein
MRLLKKGRKLRVLGKAFMKKGLDFVCAILGLFVCFQL